MLKRPRSDYDLPASGVPSTQEMHNYLARVDNHDGPPVVNETKTIGSAYGHYLQHEQLTSFTSAEASNFSEVGLGRLAGGGMTGLPLTNHVAMARSGAVRSDIAPNCRGLGFGGRLPMDALNGREMGFDGRLPVDAPRGGGVGFDGPLPMDAMPRLPLPPDASNTLYAEGLPPDVTRREVAHIFRPFVGYEDVRLVTKESRHRGGDPLILCFVDFTNPACAATALSALQGYKMDEHDRDSAHLRLQFSKFPGARAGSKHRGKR
ncbi:RNA-binding protein like [Actinidia chinensis var. chinensis]|uniref:RNA-binding protein like n=1 Tax=Actinidia chinensis var. chinensis TaxID=1590841 RepID=A0A2R6QYP3_ACTCC|nr:RNA-binding protein like [Actinidia chinensis var. chinensis]